MKERLDLFKDASVYRLKNRRVIVRKTKLNDTGVDGIFICIQRADLTKEELKEAQTARMDIIRGKILNTSIALSYEAAEALFNCLYYELHGKNKQKLYNE